MSGRQSPGYFCRCLKCAVGWGPKAKIGQINKILWVQLGLYIRKPGEKSLTQKKFILMRGIAFEKNGPRSRENEVKIPKKTQNGQKSLFEVRFGFQVRGTTLIMGGRRTMQHIILKDQTMFYPLRSYLL